MDKIYEITMPIIGIEGVIMGITLLVICFAQKHGRIYNKSALIFLSNAMLMLGAINLVEYFVGVNAEKESESLAVVIFAAAIELFLLLFAYVSMLNPQFPTKKRIFTELGLIMAFTFPAICVIPLDNNYLFNILFSIGLIFYIVKLGISLHVYKKNLKQFTDQVSNFHSNSQINEVQWISNTFYVVISIGIISVVVPLTNFGVLAMYNCFLFFAYLYIYISFLRNIYTIDNSIVAVVHAPDHSNIVLTRQSEELDQTEESQLCSFMSERQVVYQRLISKRFYATPSITADKVASLLNTNRTMLSSYLNQELNMSYYEWIAHLRIEDAKKQLIENPNMPVVEIAFNVGIEDKSNFGRTFKRIVGLSPLEYRKQHFQQTTNH